MPSAYQFHWFLSRYTWKFIAFSTERKTFLFLCVSCFENIFHSGKDSQVIYLVYQEFIIWRVEFYKS